MVSLRTFIAERRSQILREIETLSVELSELDKVESALTDQSPQNDVQFSEPTTLKGMSLYVLRKTPSGLTANQILERIRLEFGAEVARSSLSPQLSRLRNEGILVREGKNWRRVGATNKEAAYLAPPI